MANSAFRKEDVEQLAKELEHDMLALYKRAVISDETLSNALGYKNLHSFRQAIFRNRVGVPVFSFKQRRGKYALVKDVAQYLATERCKSN